MKKIIVALFFVLFLFCGFVMNVQAQCAGGRCTAQTFNNKTFNSLAIKKEEQKEAKTYYYEEVYDEQELYAEQAEYEKQVRKDRKEFDYNDDEFEPKKDIPWKRKGFEFYIGGGIYFAGKKTANYYNGAPENAINLNLLIDNKYRWDEILLRLKKTYRHIDNNIEIRKDYNYNSSYDMAIDVSLGAKYRIQKNWYIELSYSFRRLTCSNRFIFDFPGGVEGNKENPPYSRWQFMVAKEDRHYIDFSVGYIMQKHEIVKPFISLGVLFNYIRIKSFHVILEEDELNAIDLMAMARYPDYVPGVMPMPNYQDWAGPGYGFSLTLGLKIAFNRMVSLDPVFQLSVGNFGNNKFNLPSFDTSTCLNYMAGVRIVMNDALFAKKQ